MRDKDPSDREERAEMELDDDDLGEILAEIDLLAGDDADVDESEFDDLPPVPFDGAPLEEALEKAQKLVEERGEELVEELRGLVSKDGGFSPDDLFDAVDQGKETDVDELAKVFALLLAVPIQAQARDCDCSRELAALQRAQAAVRRAQAALQLAQANLAAARAARRRAQAVERRAWRAYRAAQRLTARVCGGAIGRLDPLCLVAITYEAIIGNKWRLRAQQLRAAQQAEIAAIRLARIARLDLVRAQQIARQALLDYLWCLIRCLFGF